MNNFITDFEKKLKIIDYLSAIDIEYGIFAEDEHKTETVNILNLDNTKTETRMTVGDIMYFTEHGTLTIPAKPILTLCLWYISTNLDNELNKIIENVLNYNWTTDQVLKELNDFCVKMEIYIRSRIDELVDSNAMLANLLDTKEENNYLYDLKKLKNYIKCKIIFARR